MVTTPTKNDINWDVSLNAALTGLQAGVDGNAAGIAANSSRLTTIEGTANGDLVNLQAAEAGYRAMNFPAEHMDPTGQAPTTGVIYLNKVVLHQTTSVTNLNVWVSTLGSALTGGQNFMGIYDSSGNRVAQTADQSSVWNTAGWKSVPVVGGPFNLTAGFYWIAILANGVTGLTFGKSRSSNLSAALVNGFLGANVGRWVTNGTGTSLPSTITPGSNALSQLTWWVGAA